MINGEKFFDQPIKNKNENIRKIATGQEDDYKTGCLLDYSYFKNTYKMIAVDLSKQQVLDADPRTIQQINFTANLDRYIQNIQNSIEHNPVERSNIYPSLNEIPLNDQQHFRLNKIIEIKDYFVAEI